MKTAQGHDVAGHLGVEGAKAHQVDGGLEHRHPVQGRVAGQGKSHAFVAASNVPLEAGAVEKRAPAGAQRSGSGGKRRSSGMSELSGFTRKRRL